MKTTELLAIRLAAGKGHWLSPEGTLRLLHETVMRGKERDDFATRLNRLDSVLEGIRGLSPEDPEDAVEEAYDRPEERRRYVRERYGSDLTNPQADYLAEAEPRCSGWGRSRQSLPTPSTCGATGRATSRGTPTTTTRPSRTSSPPSSASTKPTS